MALKLKYTDEHGILHINMSPSTSPVGEAPPDAKEITYPKFDSINNRFGQYDIFGGKYSGGETERTEARSLFRSRYNSIEEELANTPYAFTTDRSVDITIQSRPLSVASPSKDIEDDRFFNRSVDFRYDDALFGPQRDVAKTSDEEETPAFTITQLIHAQDRYFDLSSKQSGSLVSSDSPGKVGRVSVVKDKDAKGKTVGAVKSDVNRTVRNLTSKFEVRSAPSSARKGAAKTKIVDVHDSDAVKTEEAFKVLSADKVLKAVQRVEVATKSPVQTSANKKKESSFAILTETSISSRPSSPRSLPIETRLERVSPFRGRGFREETSRHTTPKASRSNSRQNSPSRRRTNSLSRIDKMAAVTLPPPIHSISRPHSPRNFVKQNIEEVRELSELNREQHEAEAEKKKREEEEALLKEMGLLDKNGNPDAVRSVVGSRTTSRSNSPSKINLRSRSNSPSAILHFENIAADSKDFINPDDGMSKPVAHRSRMRSVSRSQPQSNNGSPKHSKIPKRQNSVSPPRQGTKRDTSASKKLADNNLTKNQRFISNSTSSLTDAIRIGGTVSDKKGMSKSSQYLSISPNHIRGKPPISPGRGGPPPSNKYINPKRLSPIVGTPNKSPVEDLKPSSAKTPTKGTMPGQRKPVKTAGNTPVTSRLTSRQPSRAVSPDKKKNAAKPTANNSKPTVNKTPINRPVNRTPSTKTTQKPSISSKPEVKKPINRTNSIKSLTRTPSTKTLNAKPPLQKKDSKRDLKERAQSNTKINEVGNKKGNKEDKEVKKEPKTQDSDKNKKDNSKNIVTVDAITDSTEKKSLQDNETQYDSITNEKGELITLTKKNVVSMTTAAITAQPLEVVTTVTNQLPAAFEKAREKGIFERLSSKDSLAPKEEEKTEIENSTAEDKKSSKPIKETNPKTMSNEDSIKLKLLQPPYNNPQVERVKQKIDDILKTPEVSTENILSTAAAETKETKNSLKTFANKAKNDIKDKKDETTKKFTQLKEEAAKQTEKEAEKISEDIRTEATKIVESIITPVEDIEAVVAPEKPKEEPKKTIEPIVMVVNERKKNVDESTEIVEKVNEALVKGEPEVEVQSSNMSTPVLKKGEQKNMVDGAASDHSTQSNGGFPQSTSTTPKPPARAKRDELSTDQKTDTANKQSTNGEESPKDQGRNKKNICQRLMGKCAKKSKCCGCCVKPDLDEEEFKPPIEQHQDVQVKTGMSKWSCCKKKETEIEEKMIKDADKGAGKLSTIEFENERKGKRSLRDVLCGCCGRKHRVGDSAAETRSPSNHGCWGRNKTEPEFVERRDSILSDRPPRTCCNNRLCNWLRGACGRHSEHSSSRRTSLFSKNKSLSPTLPPEDTRSKLDPSLIEHMSVMRGAIPVLPAPLAYFCLVCNVLVPGLGTIFSGLFCLCFGIPRFGVHDGLKHRIGSFMINLLVGCGQLFTVLFCLVGWGWSIWWGVIMVRVSRKYRKLKAEAAAEDDQAPPVTTNNHHSRA